METAITNGIKVVVQTEFQPFYSDPFNNQYAFSYKINIENHSDYTVKLLARKWLIFDAINSRYIVEGDGVVGFQPVIEPGGYHEYVSGCNFKSSLGKMSGFFKMERVIDGVLFEVDIPEFIMMHPSQYN